MVIQSAVCILSCIGYLFLVILSRFTSLICFVILNEVKNLKVTQQRSFAKESQDDRNPAVFLSYRIGGRPSFPGSCSRVLCGAETMRSLPLGSPPLRSCPNRVERKRLSLLSGYGTYSCIKCMWSHAPS